MDQLLLPSATLTEGALKTLFGLEETTIKPLLASLLLPAACARTAAAQDAPLPVVATFSILADMAREVGGDAVSVASLVPPGGDAHLVQLRPADLRALREAKVAVENGLGLEGLTLRLIASSGFAGTRVVAAQGIAPLPGDRSGAPERPRPTYCDPMTPPPVPPPGGASAGRRPLRRVDETSAGGLVLDRLGSGARGALIGRLDRRGRLLWSLPKGHVEAGETEAQTAVVGEQLEVRRSS